MLGAVTVVVIYLLIGIGFLSSVCAGCSIETIWAFLYTHQILQVIPCMKLYFPTNTLHYLSHFNFVNFKIDFLQTIFNMFIISTDKFSPENFSHFFERFGYPTQRIFVNIGDVITVWIIAIIIYPFLLFCKLTKPKTSFL